MSQTRHSFDILLGNPTGESLPAIVVAFGEDAFLRKETVHRLMLHAGLDANEIRVFDGDECGWVDVHDELATLSLFESNARRVARIQNGDKLVKAARPQLEKWFASPAEGSLLLMELHSFPSNTKLYKAAAKDGWCVNCSLPTAGRSKAPDLSKLKQWLVEWAALNHGVKLQAKQAGLIVDSVGIDCGLLHQEIGKLALYANEKGELSSEALIQNLGTWRTRTMWEIADAIADGKVAVALEQLERVFSAGEHPAAIVPQVSWSLRRYGRAANLMLQAKRTGGSLSVQSAISQCGFWGNDLKLAEQRIRRLGLRRTSQILEWLLELDLKIKGSHSNPQRAIFAIEQMCLKFI